MSPGAASFYEQLQHELEERGETSEPVGSERELEQLLGFGFGRLAAAGYEPAQLREVARRAVLGVELGRKILAGATP